MTDLPLYAGMLLEDARYELIEKIGSGEQAEIWSIINRTYPQQRLVAKLWHTRSSARSERKFQQRHERLEQEARILGNIVNTYTVEPHFRISTREDIDGVEHIILGVAMDLATEGSLDAYLERNPMLPMLQRVRIMEQLATGLDDLQQGDVVHNDIKPGNILVFRSGENIVPMFSDFGLAFIQGTTPVGGGTLLYMAPELINEFGRPSFNAMPSERTDIFSLGVVFFEILLGVHPYADIIGNGDGAKALGGYYSTQETIDFGISREEVDPAIKDIVQRMCSRDPENRPSMFEVCEELADASFRLRGQAPLQFLTEYPDAVDTFRWADEVHRAFNESEQLIFLRGSDMERDPQFLAKALHARRMHGFSIMKLLGSRDYLLRVWRRDADKSSLSEVLEAYEAERSGVAEAFDPVLRWPEARATSRLPLHKPTEMLAMIHALSTEPKDDLAIREAMRVGLITGRSKKAREADKKGRKAIRAICRVNYSKDLRLERVKAIGDDLYQKALKLPGIREVEVFANPGVRGVSAEFVVIVELDNFHRFKKLLVQLEETLSIYLSDSKGRMQIRFRSHFEMDEQSTYESYDGRLFFELYRRRKSRDHNSRSSSGGHADGAPA